MERSERLAEVAGIAVRIAQSTGLPPQLLIAQWAVESRWGERPAGNANFFGVKRATRHAQYCTVTTQEVIRGNRITTDLEFADYESLEESCQDYAWLITHGTPYAEAWRRYRADLDLGILIRAVASVYATDPRYAELLIKIAGQTNVRESITRARGSEAAA